MSSTFTSSKNMLASKNALSEKEKDGTISNCMYDCYAGFCTIAVRYFISNLNSVTILQLHSPKEVSHPNNLLRGSIENN